MLVPRYRPRTSNSYRHDLRNAAAAGDYVVTDDNEKEEEKEKGPPCERCLEAAARSFCQSRREHARATAPLLGRRAWQFLRRGRLSSAA